MAILLYHAALLYLITGNGSIALLSKQRTKCAHIASCLYTNKEASWPLTKEVQYAAENKPQSSKPACLWVFATSSFLEVLINCASCILIAWPKWECKESHTTTSASKSCSLHYIVDVVIQWLPSTCSLCTLPVEIVWYFVRCNRSVLLVQSFFNSSCTTIRCVPQSHFPFIIISLSAFHNLLPSTFIQLSPSTSSLDSDGKSVNYTISCCTTCTFYSISKAFHFITVSKVFHFLGGGLFIISRLPAAGGMTRTSEW